MKTISRKFFAIGLLAALLVCSTGRAIPAFALADPQPEYFLSPVYDTTIYQFSDYVDNLSDPQYEIMKIALGIFMLAQSGSQNYQLEDPYTTRDGVIGFLKSTGLTLYNMLISLAPDTYIDPVTGEVGSTAALKEATKFAVAYGMGAAVLAANYNTEQEFLDDIENRDDAFLYFGKDMQTSINNIVAINGGFYNAQFTESDWDNLTLNFIQLSGAELDIYTSLCSDFAVPHVLYYRQGDSWRNNISTSYIGDTYLFFNTSTGYAYLVDSLGQQRTNQYDVPFVSHYRGSGPQRNNCTLKYRSQYFATDTRSYVEIANDYFSTTNFPLMSLEYQSYDCGIPIYNIFIKGVFYGTDWTHKAEVLNQQGLGLLPNMQPYFDQIENNYLLDIKGLLEDLVNETDLHTPVFNNIYDLLGNLVTNVPVIKVSINIPDLGLVEPLPVNLNDIAEYTDNSYIERVKEEAKRGGNALAYLVAFWHNCDAELVYVLFGAGITVLVGAFIGKWGHS